MASENLETYVVKWLETATAGIVTVTFAFLTNRMQLHCKKCHAEYTCPKPANGNEIDYGVQEFVKLHAHKVDQYSGFMSYKNAFNSGGPMNGTPIKLTNIEPPFTGKADYKPEKAEFLASKMADYEAEMKQKLTDVALANKIKVLQMQDKAKAEALAKVQQKVKEAEEAKTVYYDKKALATLKTQTFQMFQYQPLPYSGEGPVENHPDPPPPPVKKDKPLKRVEGRKFR